MGRRFEKKVTVNGTITLHHRYLYRGYLQIVSLDAKRANMQDLWLIHWDPTQPTATRPLSIRKNGTWYTYGHDLTKNVMEVFNTSEGIATSYDYTPFGEIAVQGSSEQPIQWSSEVYDEELALTYYNYRHYNPMDGRWINRDPIAERGGYNLYGFVGNGVIWRSDYLGESAAAWVGLAAFFAWAGCAANAFHKAAEFATNDKLRHCYASCLISKDCGKITSIGTGTIKKMTDILREKVYEFFGEISEEDFGRVIADSLSDLHADILCLNEKDEKGCECCCRKKINQVM